MRAKTVIAALVLAGLALPTGAACAREEAKGGGVASERAGVAADDTRGLSPSDTAEVEASFPASTPGVPRTSEFGRAPRGNRSDAAARLVDLQVGRGDGVERLLFTFADTDVLPKYRVRYVDAVRAHAEDDPIPLRGTAYLEVSFSLTNPNTKGRLAVPADLEPEQPLIKQTVLARNVGRELGFGVGLARRAEFRTKELYEPTRLIVEVRSR
jgi:hypothetical protein